MAGATFITSLVPLNPVNGSYCKDLHVSEMAPDPIRRLFAQTNFQLHRLGPACQRFALIPWALN